MKGQSTPLDSLQWSEERMERLAKESVELKKHNDLLKTKLSYESKISSLQKRSAQYHDFIRKSPLDKNEWKKIQTSDPLGKDDDSKSKDSKDDSNKKKKKKQLQLRGNRGNRGGRGGGRGGRGGGRGKITPKRILL